MKISRRTLLKGSLASLIVAPIVWAARSSVAIAKAVTYKKSDLATSKKNPSITAFKYVDDASKSTVRTAAKMGVAAKDQLCSNCNFYKNEGTLEGGKVKAGQCLMLQNQIVYADGWCNIWAGKPKAAK